MIDLYVFYAPLYHVLSSLIYLDFEKKWSFPDEINSVH